MGMFDHVPMDRGMFDGVPMDKPAPKKIGKDAYLDDLRQTLEEANPFTRNIAAIGTAVAKPYQGIKQMLGFGDDQAIAEQSAIANSAPAGAITGNVLLGGGILGAAGKTLATAAGTGAVLSGAEPVESGDFTDEKLKQMLKGSAFGAGGKVLGDAAAKYVTGKMAEIAARKAANAERDATFLAGRDLGLVVPPSAVNPTFAGNRMEGLGGKVATEQQASIQNIEAARQAINNELRLPTNSPLTDDAMRQVIQRESQLGYAPIANAGRMQTTPQLGQDLYDVVAPSLKAARDIPGAARPQLDSLAAAQVPRNGSFDPQSMLTQIGALRDQARAVAKSTTPTSISAQEYRDMAKALETELERGLMAQGQNGAEMARQFRESRTMMAKAHAIEDSILEGSGNIDPAVLARMIQKNGDGSMTGAIGDIARFANTFGKSMNAKATGPGVSKLNFMESAGLGGAGSLIGGPIGAAIGSAVGFAAPPLLRRRLLSDRVQNSLLENLYSPSATTTTINALRDLYPAAGFVADQEYERRKRQ